MDASQHRNFFDSRDKYLSFVHTTDEKIRTAFYLSEQIGKLSPQQPFYLLDAGVGDGTVITTFLTALHKKMPNVPIVATGKEISIDDICILLGYLPDRFAEHKSLIFNITNLTYRDMENLAAVDFVHVKKELSGDTAHDFGLQLMNMADFVKENWALQNNSCGGLVPRQKILLTLYRRDQKVMLRHVIPKTKLDLPTAFDFIVASQPFRLRRPLAETAAAVILPLLRMLKDSGQMVLFYASGRDFSRPLLAALYPQIRPYQNTAPQKLLRALGGAALAKSGIQTRISSLHYGFINMYLERRDFSLGGIVSLWKALTYVGQISDMEQKIAGGWRTVEKTLCDKLPRVKNMVFVNHVIHFYKKTPKK